MAYPTVAALGKRLEEQFPTQGPILHALFELSVGPDSAGRASNTKSSPIGLRLQDPTSTHVLQCTTTGFTLSRLAPYETWEELEGLARQLWPIYRDAVEPSSITRLAVRYINSIPLPVPANFDDYLVAAPQIPRALPQGLAAFLQRLVIPDPGTRNVAVVIQALEEAVTATAREVPVILDVDVFRLVGEQGTADNMWDVLQSLREYKNQIFFECITERTAEMFE